MHTMNREVDESHTARLFSCQENPFHRSFSSTILVYYIVLFIPRMMEKKVWKKRIDSRSILASLNTERRSNAKPIFEGRNKKKKDFCFFDATKFFNLLSHSNGDSDWVGAKQMVIYTTNHSREVENPLELCGIFPMPIIIIIIIVNANMQHQVSILHFIRPDGAPQRERERERENDRQTTHAPSTIGAASRAFNRKAKSIAVYKI